MSSFLTKTSQAIDSLIKTVSPVRGLRRERARSALTMLSAYRGAEKTRFRDLWTPRSQSADAALLPELDTLRRRSQDLNRNDGTAAAITGTIVVNTVGTGLKPQAAIDTEGLNIGEKRAQKATRQFERNWERWIGQADSQERLSFYEMQSLIERQILESGEVCLLPVHVNEFGRHIPLAFEVIEAERLATPPGQRHNPNVRDGVLLGNRGQPLGYYINKGDLGKRLYQVSSSDNDFVFYPARNERTGEKTFFHLYWMKRARQTRGEPFFAPVMLAFKDLADYLEAEIVAARIQACFAIIFESPDPMALGSSNTTSTESTGQRLEEIEPGMVHYAATGEKATMVNPTRPGGNFDPFVDRVVRFIGSALGLPYELVAKDFSKVNYSSARAAILEARRFFRVRQQWMSFHVCQPVWNMVQTESWIHGHTQNVNLFSDDADLWLKARWIAPGWGWVDPVKEVKAAVTAIDAGLSTLADECASARGSDWEDVARQLKREQTFYDAEGIARNQEGKAQNGEPNGNGTGTDNEDEEDEEKRDVRNHAEGVGPALFSHAKGNGTHVGTL